MRRAISLLWPLTSRQYGCVPSIWTLKFFVMLSKDFNVLAAGIPKFYRWLSERYPLLNMSVTATDAPPEIDNLYLDMNGIIHNCTHANDPNLKLTETEMIVRIFSYLDKLIQIVKPKKLIFMAIDGERIAVPSFASLFSEHVTEAR